MARNLTELVLATARRNSGLVTVESMRQLGVSPESFRQWAHYHKPYDKFRRGAYVFGDFDDRNSVDENDLSWFLDMYTAGKGSYFIGSSVLNFYNLGRQEAQYTFMRSPSRKPFKDKMLKVSVTRSTDRIDTIRGIRLQSLYQAFQETCNIRKDYLLEAAEQAWDRNLLTDIEYGKIEASVLRGKEQ